MINIDKYLIKEKIYCEAIYGKLRHREEFEKFKKSIGMRIFLSIGASTALTLLAETQIFIVLALISSILIVYHPFKKLRDEFTSLNKSLSLGLEKLISEFTLILSTGMTLEKAFSEAGKNPPDNPAIRRLYQHIEEERSLGFSLFMALTSFAGLFKNNYLYKFNTILAMSNMTGSKRLEDNLNQLKTQIIEDERAVYKRKAETLSTKLLLPLMLSLMGIFAMIMVPIFLQFGL